MIIFKAHYFLSSCITISLYSRIFSTTRKSVLVTKYITYISKNLFKTFYNLSYLANTFVSKVISTTIGLLYNFLSFYDPTIFKIVAIGSLRANATLLDAVLALWGLNMLMSIPAAHMTDFIHLPIVSLDTHLSGFCFTINSLLHDIVTFFLSSFVLSRLCLITRTIHSLSSFRQREKFYSPTRFTGVDVFQKTPNPFPQSHRIYKYFSCLTDVEFDVSS